MAGPGRPKTGGRQSGTPNKLTRDLREMVLSALDKAGGVEYLVEQARANPAPFLTLVGEAMPQQVERGKPGDFSVLLDQQLEERVVAGMVAKGIPEAQARAFVAERKAPGEQPNA